MWHDSCEAGHSGYSAMGYRQKVPPADRVLRLMSAAFLVTCFWARTSQGGTMQRELRAGHQRKDKFFLSACAQFKDEDNILPEWIEHYLREGVEHFFLIDDGSTDRSHAVLKPYIDEGLITLMVDIRKNHNPPISMEDRYNLLFKPFHYLTTWMIHIDLDEFVYGRHGTVASFLKKVEYSVGEIRVPWKNYGSSGHVAEPTGGIIPNFLHRRTFNALHMMYVHTKPIFRTAALIREHSHHVKLKEGYYSGFALRDRTVGPFLHGWPVPSLNKTEWDSLSDEQMLGELEIHLNHYCIRWKEWFMKVKATRGIADRDVSVYDEQYFKDSDLNEIFDDELARRHSS